MTSCTLSGISSWFTCLSNNGVPFGEVVTLVVFAVFFLLLKNYPTREALIAASFAGLVVSGAFLGMGAINPFAPVVMLIILGISAVFLSTQNSG